MLTPMAPAAMPPLIIGCLAALVISVVIASLERHGLNECIPFTQSNSSPRIMITGGAGFMAMALVKSLKQMNYTSVKVIGDINQMSEESMVVGHGDFCIRDLSTGRGSYRLLVHAEWVIHLAILDAAQIGSESSLLRQRRIDSNVLRSIRHNNVSRYLYTGSNKSLPFDRNHDMTKNIPNARSKLNTYKNHSVGREKLIGHYEVSQTKNIDTSFLEVHNVYGDGANYLHIEDSNTIPVIIWKSINDRMGGFSIAGDGVQKRDYVFVDDVVNALVSTVQRGGFEGIVQIGSGYTTDLQNVTDYIADFTRHCLKKGIQIYVKPLMDNGTEDRAAMIERGQQVLSWTPTVPIKLGIAMNYAWILRDMAHRSKSNRRQLLRYANCMDDEINIEKQKHIVLPILSTSTGDGTANAPPPGLISDVLSTFTCPNDRMEILDEIKNFKAPRKTLVILTTSTRAHHLTFQNFQSNVLDVLDADLALSVETQKYPTPDGYRSAAKYIWEMNPPKDFDFMHFYDQISTKCFNHPFNESYAQIVGTVGAVSGQSGWLGCIKAAKQNACCAQMLFYRWFALQNILKEKLYLQYDTVIVSRSDFYWVGPHEKLDIKRGNVYVPEGEDYGGVYDRHYALSMYDAISALAHAEIVVEREDPYKQKEYLISQGCDKGSNLEFAHYIWLTNIMKLEIVRYHHSGLLVTDASDEIPDRWGIRTLRNINGMWLLVKYVDELEPLRRFNVIFYRKRKFSFYNMYLTAKMYFGF